MKATRFMRIPFFVLGHQVTEQNMDAIARWCEGHVIRDVAKPFVRVPVDRPTNRRQTEAYVGTWVIVSTRRGQRSFKVYTQEWLVQQFMEMPEGTFELEQDIPGDGELGGGAADNNVRSLPMIQNLAPVTEVRKAY